MKIQKQISNIIVDKFMDISFVETDKIIRRADECAEEICRLLFSDYTSTYDSGAD